MMPHSRVLGVEELHKDSQDSVNEGEHLIGNKPPVQRQVYKPFGSHRLSHSQEVVGVLPALVCGRTKATDDDNLRGRRCIGGFGKDTRRARCLISPGVYTATYDASCHATTKTGFYTAMLAIACR
eukprot:52651-Pelagomonas_calceolata.AAC.2